MRQKAKKFYELQLHDNTSVVGRMDKDEIIELMASLNICAESDLKQLNNQNMIDLIGYKALAKAPKRFLHKYIVMPRFILSATTDKNIFKLEYKKGDECWRNSIWLTYWWFGRNYWLVVFL